MKKILMAILIAALAGTMLCACGASSGNEEEGLGDVITDEEQYAEEDTEDADVSEGEGDYEAEGEYTEDDYEDYGDEDVMGGLALVGPEYTNMTNIREDNYDDGTYYYEDMTEDAITVITNMCYPNSQRDGQAMDAYAENIVCAQVDNDAVITETVEDSELAAKLSYPVYKISYESGSNEDTRQAVGVVVLTDFYTFYYGYSCPIDYFEENADFYEGELKDVELMEY